MKNWQVRSAIVLCMTAASTTHVNAQGPATQNMAIRGGDVVVFYGDSITALHLYTRFVEEFALTRYPMMRIRYINAGVPGDATYGGYAGTMQQRVQRDVTPFRPAMITLMLGMNDGGYVPMTPQIDSAFRKGYNDLLDALIRDNPKAAFTLILPTPYDEITHGTEFPGYSKTIDTIAEDVAEVAAQRKVHNEAPVFVVDFHDRLVAALRHAETEFPVLAPLLIPDRIHPGPAAQWIMAAALMEAWHVNPLVSDVSLTADDAKVTAAARTKISDLRKTSTGLRWTQLDEALPLPLDLNDAMTGVLIKVSDIGRLDLQLVQISGLSPANYDLLIDQRVIATFSAEALERGVNLALIKTPMLDQARGIDWEENRRATLDEARFILSAETARQPNPAAAEERLQVAEDELAATIQKQALPKPHDVELRKR